MTVAKLEKVLISEVKNFDFHIARHDSEIEHINERFDAVEYRFDKLERRFDVLYNAVEDIKVEVAYLKENMATKDELAYVVENMATIDSVEALFKKYFTGGAQLPA